MGTQAVGKSATTLFAWLLGRDVGLKEEIFFAAADEGVEVRGGVDDRFGREGEGVEGRARGLVDLDLPLFLLLEGDDDVPAWDEGGQFDSVGGEDGLSVEGKGADDGVVATVSLVLQCDVGEVFGVRTEGDVI